jgi:predicted nucleic acid-binding protein
LTEILVLDASAMVPLLVPGDSGQPIAQRIRGSAVHVPAHFDAEVLSALGRLHRAGHLEADVVTRGLDALAQAPFTRHPLSSLLAGAWGRRGDTRLVDALYIALAVELSAPIITLDRSLAASAPRAELPGLQLHSD